MIQPLQMHQLVDDHVVTDGVRHRDEPPIQADMAVARAGSPPPALIADADAGDREAMESGKLDHTGRKDASRPSAELLLTGVEWRVRREGTRRHRDARCRRM